MLLSNYAIKDRHVDMDFSDYASPGFVKTLLDREFHDINLRNRRPPDPHGIGDQQEGRFKKRALDFDANSFKEIGVARLKEVLERTPKEFGRPAAAGAAGKLRHAAGRDTQSQALYAILASWAAILLYLWFRFGNWTFGAGRRPLPDPRPVLHPRRHRRLPLHPRHPVWRAPADSRTSRSTCPRSPPCLTLVGYSVSDTIVVFDRIREVRGKNPDLTPKMINDSVNQTLSRTLLTSLTVWLVVIVLYVSGGEGVHLFAFVMVVGVIVGTYSSIYIASPLLLIFGEGKQMTKSGDSVVPANV